MKKSAFILFAAFALVACEKGTSYADLEDSVEVENQVEGPTKTFTFTVKGEFEAATFKAPGMRRAGGTTYLNDSGNDITDLWVYDYMGGTLIQSVHQSAGDDNFGKPKMSLAYGEHHIYFVASRGADPVINEESHVISWSTVRDTFWKDYEVNVVSTSNGNRAVTLDRVATKLKVTIKDEVPAACTQLSLTPSVWYYGLDYVNGLAVRSDNKERTVTVPASYAGASGQLVMSIFGLSDTDEWTSDVVLKSLDDDGKVLGQVTLSAAPFKRNRATEYCGNLFGSGGGIDVSLNDTWEQSFTAEW